MNDSDFFNSLYKLPDGTYDVLYDSRRYLLSKELLLDGRLIKLYAKELGGNDIVSGNYYITIKDGTLKPCEMSQKRVVDFVMGLKLL